MKKKLQYAVDNTGNYMIFNASLYTAQSALKSINNMTTELTVKDITIYDIGSVSYDDYYYNYIDKKWYLKDYSTKKAVSVIAIKLKKKKY